MSIKQLPKQLRPREKLLTLGADKLTDAELLAIILRTGINGKDVLHLASEILSQFNGFAGLLNSSAQQLKQTKGLGGDAKRAELCSIIEIAKRSTQQQISQQNAFENSQRVKQFCQLHLSQEQQEVFAVLFLDNQHQLIKFEKIFFGSVSQTAVYPREIIRKALLHNASAVIFTHNHPGGRLQASAQDIELSKNLKRQLDELEIRLLDHIIVTPNAVLSMAEQQLF